METKIKTTGVRSFNVNVEMWNEFNKIVSSQGISASKALGDMVYMYNEINRCKAKKADADYWGLEYNDENNESK